MTTSIRGFLIINLLLSITLIMSMAIIGNLFLEHKDFQAHLDSQLALAAYTIDAFIDAEAQQSDLAAIQKRIDQIPNYINQSNLYIEETYGDDFDTFSLLLRSIQFQVWNQHDELIIHSYAAPNIPYIWPRDGFDYVLNDTDLWRLFRITDAQTNFKIVVMQQYGFRIELEKQITRDSIIIMLITYPFLALIIWVIVGRGLDSINRTTNEIRQRAPQRLDPIALKNLPDEIQPLILELNQLLKRLSKAFEREKKFAGNAAHELRTPLAALKTHTQVAMNAKSTTERKQSFTNILRSVDRSTHVVEQLLILSRMHSDAKVNYTVENIHITPLIRELLAELTPTAISKDIALSLHAPKKLSKISINITSIMIMLRNVLDNAIRYTPEHGYVNVEISEQAGHQIIHIEDNGPGIPQKYRDAVFQRFYRIMGNKETGSGLGLSIVHEISKLNHASIKLDAPKKGTGLIVGITFKIPNTK